jgi:hypothetical protein
LAAQKIGNFSRGIEERIPSADFSFICSFDLPPQAGNLGSKRFLQGNRKMQ